MRRNLYGENDIKVPLHSLLYLLVKEILSPFYVFQVLIDDVVDAGCSWKGIVEEHRINSDPYSLLYLFIKRSDNDYGTHCSFYPFVMSIMPLKYRGTLVKK